MRRVIGLLAALALAVLFVRAGSQGAPPPAVWRSTGGPLGGLGYDVRIDPTAKAVMYVTDNNAGVIRSADAGRTWAATNQGITVRSGPTADAISIFSLTVDPNDHRTLWAGTNGDQRAFGVYRSTDGGATWEARNSGISDDGFGIVFRGFTIQPGNSDVVYAQAELPTPDWGREFDRVKGRVYRTNDAGASWTLLWSGDNLARYLIVDPEDASTLYLSTGIFDREAWGSTCASGVAGAGGVGVLKSTDGGAHWTPANAGLTDLYVGALRMHPADHRVLFAAAGNNACSGQYEGAVVSGLFRSVDAGASWQKVIANDIMTTVAFAPSNPAVVYAGSARAFYRSADGGDHWTRRSKPSGEEWGPPGVRAGVPIDVTVDPDDPNLLYANNYGGGVFRSRDGAASWEEWSRGYSGADVHALAVSAAAPTRVLAIGRSGPYRSDNYGLDWTGIGTGAANFAEWYAIAAQPGHPDVLLASDEHQGVILRSVDGGGSFAEVLRHPGADASSPATRMGFKALVYAPSDPLRVYAALAKDRGTIDATAPVGRVLYRSTDGGATFASPSADLDGRNVYRLVVDPADAGSVLAATSGGLFRTSDGGAHWTIVAGLGARVVSAVATDPADPARIVAAEKGAGIWVSTDGGATWPGGLHNTGLAPNPTVVALGFQGGTLLAADFYSGVYASTDGGSTWAGHPDGAMSGLAVRAVKDLAFGDGVVYAATQGGGVFRLGGPALVPSPVRADFAPTTVGSTSAAASLSLHNTGAAARSLGAKILAGAGAADFSVASDGCQGALASGASCTLEVVFSPTATGARAATLSVASDDAYPQPFVVALSGTGLAAPPPPPPPPPPPAGGGSSASAGGSGGGGCAPGSAGVASLAALALVIRRRRP